MYSKQYDCIKIYSQENKGVSVARNLGIKKSSGKYIMFLDSDDYYVDNFFDNQFEYKLNKNYDLLVYSSYVLYMMGGESHSVRYMRATTKPLVRATSSDKRASPYRLAS